MPVWVGLVIVGAVIGFWIVLYFISGRIDKNLLRQKSLLKKGEISRIFPANMRGEYDYNEIEWDKVDEAIEVICKRL